MLAFVEQPIHDPTLGTFRSVDAGTSIDSQDVTSKSLLDELNEKRARHRLTPWIIGALIAICGLLCANEFSVWEIGTVVAISFPLIVIAALRDMVKKTSVVLYELDSDTTLAYAELTAAFDRAATSDRIWHVRSEASVLDRKYHAGASSVLDTDSATLLKTPPPRVETNIQPLAIKMPKRSVYLFPDRALILDAAGFGASNYQNLQLSAERSKFVTGDPSAPPDARIVEYTWRYVGCITGAASACGGTIVVKPPKRFSVAATPIPTPAAVPDAKFVTITHPAAILTPTGRITLQKGTRLPIIRVKRDSVIVHYFDGSDYESRAPQRIDAERVSHDQEYKYSS